MVSYDGFTVLDTSVRTHEAKFLNIYIYLDELTSPSPCFQCPQRTADVSSALCEAAFGKCGYFYTFSPGNFLSRCLGCSCDQLCTAVGPQILSMFAAGVVLQLPL